jgi:hypothetical protein
MLLRSPQPKPPNSTGQDKGGKRTGPRLGPFYLLISLLQNKVEYVENDNLMEITKMAKATVTEKPKAVDALVDITERAIAFRFADRTPSLNEMVRMVSTASRLLRYENQEERIEVENATVLALAKKRQLMS